MSQPADDQDEFSGSLNLCSIDEDYDENCDVTSIDRFHGLRVAYPTAALRLGQGMTVGRDASCGLVLDEPTVGGCKLYTKSTYTAVAEMLASADNVDVRQLAAVLCAISRLVVGFFMST